MYNLFLCGFMGCGKTTVGEILSNLLNTKFIDLDEHIVVSAGMPISEIFKKYSEQYFRQLESTAIVNLSSGSGVIATGGGAMLSKENADNAKNNGYVIFIDTDFEICYDRIKGDSARPLAISKTKEELNELYKVRYPLYKDHSDFIVNGNQSPIKIAEDILKLISEYITN